MDYRVEFSKWWVAEFKTIKFPSQGTVFDFYIDPETKKFEPWSKLIPQFEFDPEMPLQVGDPGRLLGWKRCCVLVPKCGCFSEAW